MCLASCMSWGVWYFRNLRLANSIGQRVHGSFASHIPKSTEWWSAGNNGSHRIYWVSGKSRWRSSYSQKGGVAIPLHSTINRHNYWQRGENYAQASSMNCYNAHARNNIFCRGSIWCFGHGRCANPSAIHHHTARRCIRRVLRMSQSHRHAIP